MNNGRNASGLSAPVPVTIVAGFLGAGKTTLLNHILTTDHGRRVAVIVNDFGSINIDAELVTDVSEGMVSLANGCICCAIRSDLITAVLDLCATQPQPDHIVIESSGVADPTNVFRAFLQPDIRTTILLDGVICVVDAEQVLSIPDQEMTLARQQVEGADLVLLNKIDLVASDTVVKARAWLKSIRPSVQVLPVVQCDAPVEVLLGVGSTGDHVARFDQTPLAGSSADQSHTHGTEGHTHHDTAFESFTYASDKPMRLGRLNQVLNKLPPELFRAKGFIYAADNGERRHLLQMVGRRAVLSADRPWGDEKRQTRLVFIARSDTCNIQAICSALGRCEISSVENA